MDVIGRIGRVRVVLGVVVLLGTTVGGAYAAGVIGMPSVSGVENRFAEVDDETTTIDTELAVENPNFFSIGLGGVSVNYTVELAGVRFAEGGREGIDLSAGNATVDFRTVMSNEQIPTWWAAHVGAGETSELVVVAEVHSSTLDRSTMITPVNREITTDLLTSFDSEEPRPVNANQPIVSDPVFYVNETSARWGEVSAEETPIEMTFVVYNPKDTPYVIDALGYDISMNGVPVGDGEIEKGATIPPKEERTIEAVTVIRNGELDEWWATHLQRNQVTDLEIDFYARLGLGGGETVRVPLDALTYTETMETDVFGNKNETDSPSTGTATPDGGDDGEGTPTETADGQPTEDSSSPTPTETPAPTETETDGGLLG